MSIAYLHVESEHLYIGALMLVIVGDTFVVEVLSFHHMATKAWVIYMLV